MKMATTNLALCECSSATEEEEEEYIDMELTSPCSSSNSPQTKEFSFQMTFNSSSFSLTPSNQNQTTTTSISTADQLFYNGKLLPLLQIPFITTCSTAPCTNTTNTPLDISPSQSCRVSCELNPDDHFFEWSTELTSFMNINNNNNNNHHHNHPTNKKPWSKKLKLVKHSVLAQKLMKASTTYLKSLFTKSDESKENHNGEAESLRKADESCSNYKIEKKKKAFENLGKAAYPTIASIIKNIDRDGIEDNNNNNVQRRSFSGAIKRRNPTKCLSNSSSGASSSSSSFSFNSSNNHELQYLRRSSSATEIEGKIEAAIAHCKKSHQVFDSRNVGICSI